MEIEIDYLHTQYFILNTPEGFPERRNTSQYSILHTPYFFSQKKFGSKNHTLIFALPTTKKGA
jgi:hypothetical protein